MINKNYIKFLKDVFLNLLASGSTVVILQLLVYPFLNSYHEGLIFGEILVDMAIVNILGVFLGSTLNNIRLKLESDYKEKNIIGDFSVLLLIYLIFGFFVTLAIFSFREKNILELLLFSLLPCLMILRTYMQVEYRLTLQYNKILINNLLYSIGLIIGLVLLQIINLWIIVFIVAEIFSLIYLLITTKIIREPYEKSILFYSTLKNSIILGVSNVISNIIIYMDRFIISIFMGPYMVAVFFASVVVGRMSTFILAPISSVVLSYLSRRKKNLSLRMYFQIHIILILFCIIASLVAIHLSKVLLPLIYPNLFNDALPILTIATIAPIIKATSTIPLTIVLKYSKTIQQVKIQSLYGIIYFLLGIIFLHFYGLLGFCIGILIANIINYIYIFFIGYRSLKSQIN